MQKLGFNFKKKKICHSCEYLLIEGNSIVLLWRFPWFSPSVNSEWFLTVGQTSPRIGVEFLTLNESEFRIQNKQ